MAGWCVLSAVLILVRRQKPRGQWYRLGWRLKPCGALPRNALPVFRDGRLTLFQCGRGKKMTVQSEQSKVVRRPSDVQRETDVEKLEQVTNRIGQDSRLDSDRYLDETTAPRGGE